MLVNLAWAYLQIDKFINTLNLTNRDENENINDVDKRICEELKAIQREETRNEIERLEDVMSKKGYSSAVFKLKEKVLRGKLEPVT